MAFGLLSQARWASVSYAEFIKSGGMLLCLGKECVCCLECIIVKYVPCCECVAVIVILLDCLGKWGAMWWCVVQAEACGAPHAAKVHAADTNKTHRDAFLTVLW